MVGKENRTNFSFFCFKNETKIHIIKFLKRNDFYVIKEIPSALVYTGNYLINGSNFESAFDVFELRQCITNDVIWYLPKQLIHFLIQTKISRFIECDKLVNHSQISHHRGSFNHRTFRKSQKEIKLTKLVRIDQNCGSSLVAIFVHSSANSEYFEKRGH